MKNPHKTALILILIVVAIFGFIIVSSQINAANTNGPNNKNVTVRTYVNITNSKPEVLTVFVYQETNLTMRNVTLSAGSTKIVNCNATIRDWNGYNDIVMVNSTLWHMPTSSLDATDNNNSHYTVSNCTNTGNGVNYTVNYLCTYNVTYYANNGTWNCSVTAMDFIGKLGNKTNTTTILPLYALNVTDGIDYGNVAVESDSLTQSANVTNFGNMAINVSVEGYGTTRGDGLAMNCSLSGNISVQYERFSTQDTGNWIDKMALNGSAQLIPNLTIVKQTAPAVPITNTTYWQLNVPPNPAGNCSGYIIFQAEAS